MTETEFYLFDLRGYLVVENALDAAEVAALNQILDEKIKEVDQGQPWFRFDHLLGWGTPYRQLIDHPRITPYLTDLLGAGFRLDHIYTHVTRSGQGPIGTMLHGGGTPFDPCQYYHYQHGRMYNGLTVVAYHLTDVSPGEGGFGCVPGSHKSNRSLPEAWRDLSGSSPCSIAVPGKAGTAILFTEALTHGSMPWSGSHERRTIFYKYSPHPSAWYRHYYNPEDYPDLTDAQKQILLSPGVYPR